MNRERKENDKRVTTNYGVNRESRVLKEGKRKKTMHKK